MGYISDPIDQLAMANSVHWHGDVLKMEDVHTLRKAFEFEGHGMKGRLKRTWRR